jgi:hypothetical protein
MYHVAITMSRKILIFLPETHIYRTFPPGKIYQYPRYAIRRAPVLQTCSAGIAHKQAFRAFCPVFKESERPGGKCGQDGR